MFAYLKEYCQASLGIVSSLLSFKRVIRTLDRVIELRGKPTTLRADNDRGISIQYIQPGKPTQNGYIERFNRMYREAVLDATLFFELDQVRQLTQEWKEEYNERRPH